MKKISFFILAALLSFAIGSPTAVHASTNCTFNTGELVKPVGNNAVYIVGNDQKLYFFPTQDVYYTWYGDDFFQVKEVDPLCVVFAPLGGPIAYRPATRLVKRLVSPKVYAVLENGELREIEDATMATELFGPNWGSQVREIHDSAFLAYEVSPEKLSTPYNSQIFSYNGQIFEYQNGQLHPFQGVPPKQIKDMALQLSPELAGNISEGEKITEISTPFRIEHKLQPVVPRTDLPEPTTTPQTPPIINHNQPVQPNITIRPISFETTTTSATLVWETNVPTDSRVFLTGGGLNHAVYLSESGVASTHRVTIEQLSNNTTYAYRIEAISEGQTQVLEGNIRTDEYIPPTPTLTITREPLNNDAKDDSVNFTAKHEDITIEAIVITADSMELRKKMYPQGLTIGDQKVGFKECSGVDEGYQEFSGINFPYPCPGREISTQEEYQSAEVLGYAAAHKNWHNKEWLVFSIPKGETKNARIPTGTEVFYIRAISEKGTVIELHNL